MSADPKDIFISPGTKVIYDGLEESGPEYGRVVHCWFSDEIKQYDCYVAFFGDAYPEGRPSQAPYILRYAASSLLIVE